MSVTRMTVFIGIMCSVWMASPLAATATVLKEFVGLRDKGSTRVKTCVNEKGGTESFHNTTDQRVELRIEFNSGDGIADGLASAEFDVDKVDRFVAFLRYFKDGDDESVEKLFRGVWSKIDERKNGRETYQLTPSGDLTEDELSGWKELLTLMSVEAGDACLAEPPASIHRELSDLVRGTLVVEDKDPKCAATTDDKKKAYNAACLSECAGGSCMKAKISLYVKAFMGHEADVPASVKTDGVTFNYKATGYVVEGDSPAP